VLVRVIPSLIDFWLINFDFHDMVSSSFNFFIKILFTFPSQYFFSIGFLIYI